MCSKHWGLSQPVSFTKLTIPGLEYSLFGEDWFCSVLCSCPVSVLIHATIPISQLSVNSLSLLSKVCYSWVMVMCLCNPYIQPQLTHTHTTKWSAFI